jgi:hypothetical protein
VTFLEDALDVLWQVLTNVKSTGTALQTYWVTARRIIGTKVASSHIVPFPDTQLKCSHITVEVVKLYTK